MEYDKIQAAKNQKGKSNATLSKDAKVAKPVSAEERKKPPVPGTKGKESRGGSGNGLKFTGDYVTLTKDQLKLLLDAAEGAKKPESRIGRFHSFPFIFYRFKLEHCTYVFRR